VAALVVVLGILVGWVAIAQYISPFQGGIGQRCLSNGTCDGDLVCLSTQYSPGYFHHECVFANQAPEAKP